MWASDEACSELSLCFDEDFDVLAAALCFFGAAASATRVDAHVQAMSSVVGPRAALPKA